MVVHTFQHLSDSRGFSLIIPHNPTSVNVCSNIKRCNLCSHSYAFLWSSAFGGGAGTASRLLLKPSTNPKPALRWTGARDSRSLLVRSHDSWCFLSTFMHNGNKGTVGCFVQLCVCVQTSFISTSVVVVVVVAPPSGQTRNYRSRPGSELALLASLAPKANDFMGRKALLL